MTEITYPRERTALLFVEPNNDFLSEGGKVYPRIKLIADEVGLLDNLRWLDGSTMVQHYVETLGERDHLILDSDVFTPTGRTKIHVTWKVSVKDIGGGKSEFTNHVRSYATDEFLTFLARQGIPFEQFRTQRQPASIAHNKDETPLFAPSIERAALRN